MSLVVAKDAGMCARDDDKTWWAGRRIHSCSDKRFISSNTRRPLAAGVTGWLGWRGGLCCIPGPSGLPVTTTVLILETPPQFLYDSPTKQRSNLIVICI